jgi:hypothetical protein
MSVLHTIEELKASHLNNVYVEETQSDSPRAHEPFVYQHLVSWCVCEIYDSLVYRILVSAQLDLGQLPALIHLDSGSIL